MVLKVKACEIDGQVSHQQQHLEGMRISDIYNASCFKHIIWFIGYVKKKLCL